MGRPRGVPARGRQQTAPGPPAQPGDPEGVGADPALPTRPSRRHRSSRLVPRSAGRCDGPLLRTPRHRPSRRCAKTGRGVLPRRCGSTLRLPPRWPGPRGAPRPPSPPVVARSGSANPTNRHRSLLRPRRPTLWPSPLDGPGARQTGSRGTAAPARPRSAAPGCPARRRRPWPRTSPPGAQPPRRPPQLRGAP